MAERELLYRGLSHAAWGYFFLFIDFNIGTVNILPGFIGFLLFYFSTKTMSSQHRDFVLLSPLCLLLFVYSLAGWVLSWFGTSLDGYMFLDILVAVTELYFHFQFLTDLAVLARQYQIANDPLDQNILTRRTILLITATVIKVLYLLLPNSLEHPWSNFTIVLAIVSFLVALLIMTALFSLRKCYWAATETPS